MDNEDLDYLIACPHCGEDIHDEVEQCPYCRQYILDSDFKRKMPTWMFVVIVLTIGSMIAMSTFWF
ncbi:MAG: hypothetical protein AB8B55_21060 [Mariniblastus sp.]